MFSSRLLAHRGLLRTLPRRRNDIAGSLSLQSRNCASATTLNPDGLTRYPGVTSPQAILRTFDWIGTISFAASGCLTAGHMGLDILGCTIVGTITAVGGGTIRDCMLNQRVFWMDEPEYIAMCIATCAAVIFASKQISEEELDKVENGKLMWMTDTLGVGAFACIGKYVYLDMKKYRKTLTTYNNSYAFDSMTCNMYVFMYSCRYTKRCPYEPQPANLRHMWYGHNHVRWPCP